MGSSTPDTIRRPLGAIDLCSSRWVRFQTGICGRLVSGQRAGGDVSASRSLSFGSPGKSLGGHLSPKAGEVFRTAHIRGLEQTKREQVKLLPCCKPARRAPELSSISDVPWAQTMGEGRKGSLLSLGLPRVEGQAI